MTANPMAWDGPLTQWYTFISYVKQKFFPCILVTFTFLLFCEENGTSSKLSSSNGDYARKCFIALWRDEEGTRSGCGFTDETTPSYQCNLGPDGRRRDADEWPDLCSGAVEFVAIREIPGSCESDP
ncbi:Gelsolin domain-containing protein [Artemisia annua]|uniref:Gelsolin domain-containing protein n=1 Tax=Artemisia annua TaxID=35608 RepID=A0A2U1NPG2_ARTAN|nr:Gelsolin domain-containing protein [Artemisia annua]